ncbi:aminotransferase, class I and II [Alkaliphilus metalliredigens QYMF]|uniref:Aminotransferase n=1 Tax=Alkaliphilus metalliredigens (strain QYMF) TaxID=293826 RepID=A6TNM5_ALKMQ|nr:LL-diaminopimelate aminotransferase [Alkaliphilus metalliredigens]ABR47793.1 aminotransferase, class I and II [Alkaliphilus metalliredigens QYMF]
MYFLEDKIAQRLGGKSFGKVSKEYKFRKIKKTKEEAIKKYPFISLIDLGVGEPDLAADERVVSILSKEAGKPENRWYADNGILEFQEAAVQYLNKVYGLKGLDPNENILHGIGTKSMLAMLPACFINPGDVVLTTIPGYPILSSNTQYFGGEIYPLPLHEENSFYPDFTAIPKSILNKAKLLYLNYPNNPTGQVATYDFYQEAVSIALQYGIVIVSDAAYGPITFDDHRPISLFSVPDASHVGIELHSLSKAFNMTGWRLAFALGSPEMIKAYSAIKDTTDSGQFRAIQKAGAFALQHIDIIEANCQRYSRRMDFLIEILQEVGFKATKPQGTFYCYVPIPKGTKSGIRFTNAEEVATHILEHALISTVPWDDVGSYLRLSVTFEAKDLESEKELLEELKRRLLSLELVF